MMVSPSLAALGIVVLVVGLVAGITVFWINPEVKVHREAQAKRVAEIQAKYDAGWRLQCINQRWTGCDEWVWIKP